MKTETTNKKEVSDTFLTVMYALILLVFGAMFGSLMQLREDEPKIKNIHDFEISRYHADTKKTQKYDEFIEGQDTIKIIPKP